MAFTAFQQRCPQILAACPELQAYQEWLKTQRTPSSRDYLFSQTRVRFEPRKQDVVSLLPGLSVAHKNKRTVLISARPFHEIVLDGVTVQQAERILRAFDGQRTLLEARWDSGVSPGCFASFLRASFGWVVFAPAAIAQLENDLSGTEITRFPTVPYGIERAYWENMIDVRAYARLHLEALSSTADVLRLLRELHVLALLGRHLNSFYKPASPIADQTVAPGALYLDMPRLLERGERTIFLDGPRVNVSLLGGQAYHDALYRSLDDAEALAPSRIFSSGGVDWGRVVTARSEKDDSFGPWFCPPRPIVDRHWDKLAGELMGAVKAASNRNMQAMTDGLASFHQTFVRLHPFHCANQSIAMNLVNAVLTMAQGFGIPHLILDLLALRLSETAYRKLLARAVRAYGVGGMDAPSRLSTLMARSAAMNAVVEAMAGGSSQEQHA
ncbi:MAG TPA: hypothetical protein PKW66_24590, partial [Polyangiaceae bacterium]|nr:hypothetical protein [Polyangiaceae bacterium]